MYRSLNTVYIYLDVNFPRYKAFEKSLAAQQMRGSYERKRKSFRVFREASGHSCPGLTGRTFTGQETVPRE